jgi:ribonuclease P protein component
MLSKKQRLNREDFSVVFKSGKRKQSDYCTLISRAAPDFRAAVVVSKKVAKTAVERNSIRRRVYALLSTCGLTKGRQNLIVIVKPEAAKLNKNQFGAEFKKVLGGMIN